MIAGIAEGCRIAGCALVGGETAEMPGMYADGDYDLAGFSVGAAERGALLPAGVAAGDAILALPSSGVHSNGFSLVRRIVADAGLGWDDAGAVRAGQDAWREALMAPTRIYVQPMLALHRAGLLKAAAHITGGGLPGNLPRALPEGLRREAAAGPGRCRRCSPGWRGPANVAAEEMLRVFNCGVGMALIVTDAEAAMDAAARGGRGAVRARAR